MEEQQRQLELEAAKAKKLERGLRAATRAKPRSSSSSSSQHLSVRGVGGSSGTAPPSPRPGGRVDAEPAESTVRSPQKSTPTDDEVAVDVSAELGEVC